MQSNETLKDRLHVIGIQIANVDAETKEQVEANVNRAINLIRNHKQSNPLTKLYILPELSSCGYPLGSKFSNLEVISETIHDSISINAFQYLSKELEVFICFGFILKQDEKFYISQGVTNTCGQLECLYRKLHLCSFGDCSEQSYFSVPESQFFGSNQSETIPTYTENTVSSDDKVPNILPEVDKLLPTFECEGFKIGLSICYDIRFPELYRILSFHSKCDVILHPSAFPRDNLSWNWKYCVTSRAIENQVYVLTINRAGKHFGASIFCPPWVSPVSNEHCIVESETVEECTVEMTVSKELLSHIRSEVTFRQDRFFRLEEMAFSWKR